MRRGPAGRGREQLCGEESLGREEPTRVRPLPLPLGAGRPLVSFPGAPCVAPRSWCPSLGACLHPLGSGTCLCPSLTPSCVILDAGYLFVPLPGCPPVSLWGLAAIYVPAWAPTCVPVGSWANSCLNSESEQIPCLISVEGFVQLICLKPSLLEIDIDDPKLACVPRPLARSSQPCGSGVWHSRLHEHVWGSALTEWFKDLLPA